MQMRRRHSEVLRIQFVACRSGGRAKVLSRHEAATAQVALLVSEAIAASSKELP